MTGWRTIDTAPRDGTRVLLWGGGNVVVGSWVPMGYGPEEWALDHDESVRPEPTHWQPLPPPPGA